VARHGSARSRRVRRANCGVGGWRQRHRKRPAVISDPTNAENQELHDELLAQLRRLQCTHVGRSGYLLTAISATQRQCRPGSGNEHDPTTKICLTRRPGQVQNGSRTWVVRFHQNRCPTGDAHHKCACADTTAFAVRDAAIASKPTVELSHTGPRILHAPIWGSGSVWAPLVSGCRAGPAVTRAVWVTAGHAVSCGAGPVLRVLRACCGSVGGQQ
jgi:hypothetical protein